MASFRVRVQTLWRLFRGVTLQRVRRKAVKATSKNLGIAYIKQRYLLLHMHMRLVLSSNIPRAILGRASPMARSAMG